MRPISLIISVIVLVALYECKVIEKGKLIEKILKTEETWNKSFGKGRLGKTKSEGEKKMRKEGHGKLRAKILNRLNDISGPLSGTKTKGIPMKTVNNLNDSSLAKGKLEADGRVGKQSFIKSIMEMFEKCLKNLKKDCYSKIYFGEVIKPKKDIFWYPKVYAAHLFIG